MPNSFDFAGRGPSNRQLFAAGVTFLLIVAAVVTFMIAKYKGALDPMVRVTAELVNVGDGLPAKSDVKFRGVLVGSVSSVDPAGIKQSNIVHIDIKPEYASGIPDTVTARVVPSNIFAVSSVQLVDNKTSAAPLRPGTVIHEDQSLPTVLFQTTLNKVRELLKAVGREPNADSIGFLTAFGEATQGRGDKIEDSGRDLNEIVTQLNSVVAGDEMGPSTISAFAAAADGLRDTAPELLSALDTAVRPMQTLAEKRSELTNFLSAGLDTVGTVADSFDNQADRLITMTSELTPVVGVLADNADTMHTISTRLTRDINPVINEGWHKDINQLVVKVVISLTPSRTYVRADCPRYGDLAGPSCFTAPEVPVAPPLTSALGSRGLPLPPGVSENRPNLAPPRGSVLPPAAPPDTPPADQTPAPSADVPPGLLPAEAPPLPIEGSPPISAGAPPAPSPQPGVQTQSAVIGGNVGPVGSAQEKAQLSLIVGGNANAATEFLLGPLARGSTLTVTPDTGGER